MLDMHEYVLKLSSCKTKPIIFLIIYTDQLIFNIANFIVFKKKMFNVSSTFKKEIKLIKINNKTLKVSLDEYY